MLCREVSNLASQVKTGPRQNFFSVARKIVILSRMIQEFCLMLGCELAGIASHNDTVNVSSDRYSSIA